MRYVFRKKCRAFMPAGIVAAMASQISFSFFYSCPYAGSLIMRWWVTIAAGFSLWYISSNSAFPCNVMTFFCFWGALPASLVALCTGPVVLFKVYIIALSTVKKWELRERERERERLINHFLLQYETYWKDELLMWRWLASGPF